MASVKVDGIMTHYVDKGTGKVVLLLHGWGDSLKTFDSLASQLEKNYRVVRLDLPGFGASETPLQEFSLSDFAHFVLHFIDKIGVKKVYAVIGHSNGGAISIKLVAVHGLQATKLVLLASSGVRHPYSTRNKSLRVAAKIAKVPTRALPSSVQKKLKKKAYHAIGSEVFVAENMQGTFRKIVTEDVTDVASHITQPTLLIYGSDDLSTPVEFGRKFNNTISSSKLFVIDYAGHFIHHDAEEVVNRAVKEFLI